ncbi:Uncharacterised protein [[Pasteurella] mairii]|uniref:ESPR domain-containing protein n=1 Tax=[Pasteurella] mairii TaxID=757 RepID=A0A379B7Y4_9PAST|nr:Uncharacterised protein [[Pasteurella] mairii]
MNKVFKLIWNHAQQRFDVTSELARSQGGGGERHRQRQHLR